MIPFPRLGPFSRAARTAFGVSSLRFSTSIVATTRRSRTCQYTLAEDANNVIVARHAALAHLRDACFAVNSVFPQTDDPAINCQRIIVF